MLTHPDGICIFKSLVVRPFWNISRSQSLYLVKCVPHLRSIYIFVTRDFAQNRCLVPVNLT